MTVLFEPAAAIAAGLCLTARTLSKDAVTTRHPRRCAWCDWPLDELRRLVEGYNAWAGYDERRGTYEVERRGSTGGGSDLEAADVASTSATPDFSAYGIGGSNSSAPVEAEDRLQPQAPGRSGSEIASAVQPVDPVAPPPPDADPLPAFLRGGGS